MECRSVSLHLICLKSERLMQKMTTRHGQSAHRARVVGAFAADRCCPGRNRRNCFFTRVLVIQCEPQQPQQLSRDESDGRGPFLRIGLSFARHRYLQGVMNGLKHNTYLIRQASVGAGRFEVSKPLKLINRHCSTRGSRDVSTAINIHSKHFWSKLTSDSQFSRFPEEVSNSTRETSPQIVQDIAQHVQQRAPSATVQAAEMRAPHPLGRSIDTTIAVRSGSQEQHQAAIG